MNRDFNFGSPAYTHAMHLYHDDAPTRDVVEAFLVAADGFEEEEGMDGIFLMMARRYAADVLFGGDLLWHLKIKCP